jgi:hypothetical protein
MEVMAAWTRIVMAAVVLVVPGGFLFLLAYLTGRAMRSAYEKASLEANGREVSFREAIAQVDFRHLVQEARSGVGFAAKAA